MAKKKFLSPPAFLCTLWGGALLFIESDVIQYVPMSVIFYEIVLTGFSAFAIGYYSMLMGHSAVKGRGVLYGACTACQSVTLLNKNRKKIFMIFFWACSLQLLILIYNIVKLTGLQFDMALYRTLLTDDGVRPDFFFLIILLNPFSYLLLIVTILYGENKWLICLAVFMSIMFATLATGRSNLLVIGLLTIWTLYFKQKLNFKIGISLIAGFFSFFFLMGIMQGKIVDDVEAYFDHVSNIVPHTVLGIFFVNIASYATSGIVAMSEYVSGTLPYYDFYYTANNFYKLFGLFFSKVPEYGILPNILVPFPTNVYSFFFAPFADWGKVGVGGVFFVYGLIGAWLFKKFERNRSDYNCMLLALFYTILTLSIFHDYVFSSLFPYTIAILLVIMKKKINQANWLQS